MRDVRLFIATLGAILVSICSSDSLNLEESAQDEPLRMASESLVVKSYKDSETTSLPSTDSQERSGPYQIYQGVMGRPGIDFPVYSAIPVTSFTCRGVKKSGYYADLETDCQVFHVCDRNRKISFLCPNGTIFRQSHLICDWWFRVDCNKSVELYEESAEQLEADQKIYKARSEARESRQKKLNKIVNSTTLKGSTTARENESNFNSKPPFGLVSGEQTTSPSFEGRKFERHSKKVKDFARTQTLGNINGNILPANHKRDPNELSLEGKELKAKLSSSGQRQYAESVSAQKFNQPLETVTGDNNQEYFFGAESGSLVEDLSNRGKNLAAFGKTNTGVATQTQEQSTTVGNALGQKRNSKKLNLNTRERNEYFSSSKETSEEKFLGFATTGDKYPTATFGLTSTSANQENPTKSQTQRQRTFTRYESQNGFSSFHVTGKTSGSTNENTQTRFVSTSYRTGQGDTGNNGGKSQFEYAAVTTINHPGNINDDGLNQNVENNNHANLNGDLKTIVTTPTAATDKPANSFNVLTEGTNFSFGTYKNVEDYQTKSFVPVTTTQRTYRQYENANGNENIDLNNYREESNGVNQNTVLNLGYSTTLPPIQLPLRHESADVSYTNNNNNDNNNNVNSNYQISQNNNQNTKEGNQFFSQYSDSHESFNLNNANQQVRITQNNKNANDNQYYVSQSGIFDSNYNQTKQKGYTDHFIDTNIKNHNLNGYQQETNATNENRVIHGGFSSTYSAASQQSSQGDNKENFSIGFTSQQNTIVGSQLTESYIPPVSSGTVDGADNNYKTSNVYNLNEGNGFKSENSYEFQSNGYSVTPNSGSHVSNADFTRSSVTGEYKEDVGSSVYTTESYESKRTNPIVRKELTTPESNQTPFSSSSPSYQDEERQYLAETASFGSNLGGNYYADYGNRYDISGKTNRIEATTEKLYQTTFEASGNKENYLTTRPVTNQFSTVVTHYKTISNIPAKQNSKKVTFSSSSETQEFGNGPWPTTTTRPYYETTTDSTTFNAENVYFTTTPSPIIEEGAQKPEFNLGLENKTLASDVNLSLQELNINKEASQTNVSDKVYEDLVRKGLEVPPSSGPNAIRSFAVYYGTANFTIDNQTEAYEAVTHHADLNPTVSSFEVKKKEVVKQVDEIVQQSSGNLTTEPKTSQDDKLPSSLTVQTKDSYLELFPGEGVQTTIGTFTKTTLKAEEYNNAPEEFVFGTTDFGAFTEEPTIINSELGNNDLDLSQTRGIVEPEASDEANNAHVTPDLRRLAQVFTKALSAYLDDPQAFRKILSEIRPTEPTPESEGYTYGVSEYPSATQEVDEVLDFSDVTKSTYKKKSFVTTAEPDLTTVPVTQVYNSNFSEVDNLILPLNKSEWATNIELTAPLLETLDESQSNYYTPLPFVGTTNQVAEEINGFIAQDKTTYSETNEEIDSYLPITTTDPPSSGKYGGFQNNNKRTTKYSPYGAELSSSPFPPLGLNQVSGFTETSPVTQKHATTLIDQNSTSFYSHFTQNKTKEDEIQLAKELNNLVLLQKFTTPRGTTPVSTTAQTHISTAQLSANNDVTQYFDVKLGNGETLERQVETRTGKSIKSNYFDTTIKPISVDLTSASSTPKGFLITYSLEGRDISSPQPTLTNLDIRPTTYTPTHETTLDFVSETVPPRSSQHNSKPTVQPFFEYNGPPIQSTTPPFARAIKSLERIVELQERLMFDTNSSTVQQKDEARKTVDKMVEGMNVTTSTTQTLMKMMEMAAKNETYKRLVLLLVNDKAAKNKTVEEARLSLLKALLTPVIQPDKSIVPITTTSKLVPHQHVDVGPSNLRRSKSIKSEARKNSVITTTTIPVTTTTTTTAKTTTSKAETTTIPTNHKARRVKVTKINLRDEKNQKKSDLGNLEVIRRTIENSKNKQVKINSIDNSAILNSDSRAVELLKSLYSLAARWG